MRIAIITLNFNTKNGGGSHLTLDLLLNFLVEKGHNVHLIASNITLGEERPRYKIIQEKIEGGFLETLDKTEKILKKYENEFDLYLIYGASMIYSGGKYKKSGGKLPVATYINSYLPSLGIVKPDLQNLNMVKKIFFYTKFKFHYLKHLIWDKFFGLRLVNFVNLIMFDSPSILEIYTKFGFPKIKSVIEPELIDTKKIIDASNNFKEIHSDKIRFIYVGRLLYDKGVDILVKATSLLKNRDDFSVTIVGRGDQKEYLEKIIQKNKLEKIVKIYPWQTQKDLVNFYKNSDIFVHPGRWPEPFGRTIIEVMSLGKMVITSNTGGTVFAMGKGGITFKKNSHKDLGMIMNSLLQNKEIIKQFKNEAEKQAGNFDYRKIAPDIEQKLINLISI